MSSIDFAPTQKFTRNGVGARWTKSATCAACGERFTGHGRTEWRASEDTEHWAEIHAAQCQGGKF